MNLNVKSNQLSLDVREMKNLILSPTPGDMNDVIRMLIVDKSDGSVVADRKFRHNKFVGDYIDYPAILTDELIRFSDMPNIKVTLTHEDAS